MHMTYPQVANQSIGSGDEKGNFVLSAHRIEANQVLLPHLHQR